MGKMICRRRAGHPLALVGPHFMTPAIARSVSPARPGLAMRCGCARPSAAGKAYRDRLERYPAKWNHLAGMILRRGKARFAWRCPDIGKEAQRRHGAKEPGLRWGKSAPRVRCRGPREVLLRGVPRDARPIRRYRACLLRRSSRFGCEGRARRACPRRRFAAIKLFPFGWIVL